MKKVVLISGGSDGIGRATARMLCKDHTVVIASRTAKKVREAVEELACDGYPCDIRSFDECQQTLKAVVQKYGRIDYLINNAGVYTMGPLSQAAPETIEDVIRINTLGTMFLTRAALPFMQKQKAGTILTVISQAGLRAKSERSIYNASKWALTGFVRCLRAEVHSDNIKVLAIFPGKVKTDLFKKAGINKDISNGVLPDDIARSIVYMLSEPGAVTIPELSITHIDN